ncbi:MAG: hypothetical protein Q9M25_04550 [Mariprofundaceae bacterium]|nr:hypothetical protein [Mariprofundaceae bacterium]
MHLSADSIVEVFLEKSVHFQTEDVLVMYAVIFVLLGVICASHLIQAILKWKRHLRTKQMHHLGVGDERI